RQDRFEILPERGTLGHLFEDRAIVNFQGTVSPARLDLVEMTWQDPAVGVVPGNEKADPTNAIVLEASPF
ncbi:MAG: hypothetical protein CVU59_12415, partial [Deltaproteobacteria bacterium HGW-Deltaproteobacteria-17]